MNEPTLREEPTVAYVQEVKPDDPSPSCHVCGAQMVPTGHRCLSCGTTTEVQPARTNITRRLATDALREYLKLREELGAFEARESECRCEDFSRCDLCTETRDKAHRSRG